MSCLLLKAVACPITFCLIVLLGCCLNGVYLTLLFILFSFSYQNSATKRHHRLKNSKISNHMHSSQFISLLNLPLNFFGGLFRSPASGCTTHLSSTKLKHKNIKIKFIAHCLCFHLPSDAFFFGGVVGDIQVQTIQKLN